MRVNKCKTADLDKMAVRNHGYRNIKHKMVKIHRNYGRHIKLDRNEFEFSTERTFFNKPYIF